MSKGSGGTRATNSRTAHESSGMSYSAAMRAGFKDIGGVI